MSIVFWPSLIRPDLGVPGWPWPGPNTWYLIESYDGRYFLTSWKWENVVK
jgi:hypothetical protein